MELKVFNPPPSWVLRTSSNPFNGIESWTAGGTGRSGIVGIHSMELKGAYLTWGETPCCGTVNPFNGIESHYLLDLPERLVNPRIHSMELKDSFSWSLSSIVGRPLLNPFNGIESSPLNLNPLFSLPPDQNPFNGIESYLTQPPPS